MAFDFSLFLSNLVNLNNGKYLFFFLFFKYFLLLLFQIEDKCLAERS